MDLTEAEDIKKRWQEYTDILECEVKWALGSITELALAYFMFLLLLLFSHPFCSLQSFPK